MMEVSIVIQVLLDEHKHRFPECPLCRLYKTEKVTRTLVCSTTVSKKLFIHKLTFFFFSQEQKPESDFKRFIRLL